MVIFHSYVSLPEGIFYLAKWFKCPPCIWGVGNNSVEKVMNPRWVLWFHKVWQNSSTYWPIGSWCGVYIIRKHWVCPEIVDPKNMFFEQTWGTWISEWRITPKLELDVDDGLFFIIIFSIFWYSLWGYLCAALINDAQRAVAWASAGVVHFWRWTKQLRICRMNRSQ